MLKLHKRFLIFVICITTLSCTDNRTKKNDNLVFRYNEHKNINSLDPAFAKDLSDIWATNQLFNGLVQMDDNLNVTPCIAKDWIVADSGKTYIFNLRKDVYFHKHHLFGKDSTRTVTAKDFVYSLNRLTDPKIASPGSWVMQKVQNFSAVNDSVFKIKLTQPFPAFLGLLTMKYCSVVPKEIVDFYGNDYRENPIGTGPFKLKRWKENIKLVLRKNTNYFEKDSIGNQLPYLEAVSITFLPDKQSEFLQFIQGNIDYVSGLDPSYKDEILTSKGLLQSKYKASVNMIKGPYLNTEYLAFFLPNTKNVKDSKILREAINYGFDRKKMITYLNNGIGTPALGGFIPKGLPGYLANSGYRYRPEYSKTLIKKYIKKHGISPEISLTTTSNYLSFCEFIQSEMQKLGLNLTIDVIPPTSLKDAKANGKLDFFRASWIADYPDAENYLSLFYSKNKAPKGPNYTHFNNKLFDSLYEASFTISDVKKREIVYKKMDSIIIAESPIIPLYYDEVVRFTRKNVNGFKLNATNLLNLKTVYKTH